MPFRLVVPVDEWRVMPLPGFPNAKLGTCFVQVDALPKELGDWMKVNPRVPRFNAKKKLVGPVAKAMLRTLDEDPEKFVLKNQGMYFLVEEMSFEKNKGGEGELSLVFTDSERHGLVNGGHTFRAITQSLGDREDGVDPAPAFVRLHVYKGVPPEEITELAEGLNRSMQVDDPSLENLRENFDTIRAQLKGQPGYDQISFRQGDLGEIHVVQVLQMMSLFDMTRFPDRKTFPNRLFGQQKAVLQHFIDDLHDNSRNTFNKILPHVHEILRLGDIVQMKLAPVLGKVKITTSKRDNRVASPQHKNTLAHFAGGTIAGKIPLGWLYPALGALRGNIDRKAWNGKKNGQLTWLMDPGKLIDEVHEEWADIIYQDHLDNNRKPAEVGRKEAAYRGCYAVVAVALAEAGRLG